MSSEWDNNSQNGSKKNKKRSGSKCICISIVGLLAVFAVACCVIVFIRQQELDARYTDMVEKMNGFEEKQWKHDKLIEKHEYEHDMEYMKQNGNSVVFMPHHKKHGAVLNKRKRQSQDGTVKEEIVSVALATNEDGDLSSGPFASWDVEKEIDDNLGTTDDVMSFGFVDPNEELPPSALKRKRSVLTRDKSDRPFSSDTTEDGDNTSDSDSRPKPSYEPSEECTGDGCLARYEKKALTFRGKRADKRIGIFNKYPTRTLDINGDMIVRDDFKVCGPHIELCGKVNITGSLCINGNDISMPCEDLASKQKMLQLASEPSTIITRTCCGSIVGNKTIVIQDENDNAVDRNKGQLFVPSNSGGSATCRLCIEFNEFSGTGDNPRIVVQYSTAATLTIDEIQNQNIKICGDIGPNAVNGINGALGLRVSSPGSAVGLVRIDSFKAHTSCECEVVPEPTPTPVPTPDHHSACLINDCPEPKPCHKVVCTLIGGQECCLDALLPDETACDDGNANTFNDQCLQGMCMGESIPPTTTTNAPVPTSTVPPPLCGTCDNDGLTIVENCHIGGNNQCECIIQLENLTITKICL